MTEKVIDSSILAKLLLKEEGWEKIIDLLLEKPYTLDLAIKETANALWKRAKLIGDISEEKALTLLDDLVDIKKLLLKTEPQDAYLRNALEIALRHNIIIYDALFIAQALAKKALLVTADKKQADTASRIGVNTLLA